MSGIPDELKDEGAQSGYAEAIHWCPHAKRNAQPIDLALHENLDPSQAHSKLSDRTVCSRCPNTQENWLCLQCHTIFCGRFAHAHMLAHFESTGHCIAAGLGDLSFWCYKCESYLYHRTIPAIYSAYAALTALKFHEAPVDPPLPSAKPFAIGEGDEDEEKESSGAAAAAAASSSSAAAAAAAAVSASAAAAAADEQVDDDGDSVMEGSRTAAAQAPVRASSQLETFSPVASQETEQEGEAHESQSSSAPSRSASVQQPQHSQLPQHQQPSLHPPASVACPIAGLTPEQMSNPFVQKLLGVIYGNCLGDAFGLATEFLNKFFVEQMYGKNYDPATGEGAIPFPHEKKTRHSGRWDHGDWTDDSDQMILIMETLLETFSGKDRFSASLTPSPVLFANKLHTWVDRGFPMLGDKAGMGLGALTHQVVSHKLFLKDPHRAAREVWERGGKRAAANGGLMRTSITGLFDSHRLERVHANTLAMCRVTHADPRCTASCVLAATIIAGILRGAKIGSEEETEAFLNQCISITLQVVPDLGEHEAVFKQYCSYRTLGELELDEGSSIGYTLKCLGAGLFGLRSRESFAVAITRLTREAGDADTNGAICGAIMGARLGYDGLPAEWLKAMPNKAWLDAKVAPLVQLILDREEHDRQHPDDSASSTQPAGANASCVAQ